MIIELVILLAQVLLQLRKLALTNLFAQRHSNHFGVDTTRVTVNELLTLCGTPRSAVEDSAIQVLACTLLLLCEIKSKYLSAQAAPVRIQARLLSRFTRLGKVLVVDMLDQSFAVLPRPAVADLARRDRKVLSTSENYSSNFESLLAR